MVWVVECLDTVTPCLVIYFICWLHLSFWFLETKNPPDEMLVAPRGRETHPGPWESCNIQSYKMQHLSFLRCLHNQIEIKTASSFLDKNYTLYWMLYWKHRPAVGKISRNPAVCWQPLFFPSSVAEARYVTELLHLVLPHSLVTLQPYFPKYSILFAVISQLVKKLQQWSLYEVIEYILPIVLNTKRPLSDI